jgi:valyl-tRNA synthetase
MSKSKGNVVTPMHLLDEYTADGVRYWAASARLGTDTAFDEKVLKVGKRLVTKLFNAGKFVLAQSADDGAVTVELDRAFVHRLRALTASVTAAFDGFDYAQALQQTESFFWHDFTDTFLELVKARARDGAAADRASAVATLRLGLSVLLRLFAPMLPYITDEVWSWAFAAETGAPSIHRAPWPGDADFAAIAPPADAASFDAAVACLATINRGKSEAGASVGRNVDRLVAAGSPATLARLRSVSADVMAAARVARYDLQPKAELDDGIVEVVALELADPPATEA